MFRELQTLLISLLPARICACALGGGIATCPRHMQHFLPGGKPGVIGAGSLAAFLGLWNRLIFGEKLIL